MVGPVPGLVPVEEVGPVGPVVPVEIDVGTVPEPDVIVVNADGLVGEPVVVAIDDVGSGSLTSVPKNGSVVVGAARFESLFDDDSIH